ncbi:hypothetical protein [Bdellovibrio sp. HCB2-146]|uniref:hypothetical protein n=1 Tax=Bdellovibrio sp. HCB2-146 TaxID=3394362 RepID=UPI0039BD773F
MFSKCRALIAMMAAVMTLSSCSIIVGEEPPPVKPQGFDSKCLSQVGVVAEAYMKGTALSHEVAASWDCVISAVEDFRRYVKGRNEDRYLSQELATFLEMNFLEEDENKISPELQMEFMKFKQLFVGGSREYITRDELVTVGNVLSMFKDVTLRLNPYMIVLSQNWRVNGRANMQKDMQFFEEANNEVQEVAKTIATQVEKNTQSYVLADFVTLMRELAKFSESDWEFPDTMERYMPIVQKVKKALAGGDETTIAPKEWRRFTLLGARGYIQYLRYHYFIKSVPETGSGYRLTYLARTVDDLLSVFQDMVSEKPEGIVSRDEVTDLLKTLHNAWPAFKVSPELVFEGMKLKQLFFGGSVDSLTAGDFDRARLKVSRIKVLIERFMPYYAVYGGEWEPEMYTQEEAQKFFMEAQFVLESTARELGSLFEGAYDLNDAYRLMAEAEALYPPENPSESVAQKVKEALPLIIDAKNMIFGGNDSSLARSNWSLLLGIGSRVYSDILYAEYFLRGKNMNLEHNIGSMSVFMNQSLNILRDVLVAKKSTQFTRAELRTLLMHLVRMDILPSNIKEKSLDDLLQVLLNNILNSPENRLAKKMPDALGLSSVEVARTEIQVWLDTEVFIARLFENATFAKDGLSGKALIEAIDNQLKDSMTPETLVAGLKELRLTAVTNVPMTVDPMSRLIITNQTVQYYDQISLRQVNINRLAARMAVRSFAGEMSRIRNYEGATLPEAEAAFVKLRPFLNEIGAVDPKNATFASSRFREANMFMPHSDGNVLASYAELADLVGMIWSGVKVHNYLKEDLVRMCVDSDQAVNDKTELKIACVRKAYRQAMPKVMTATPEYLRFMNKVSEDEWNYYIGNVMKAAGYIPNSKGIALMGDISLAPHVIQYIEMVFARFDKDKNRYITTSEAKPAYATFKGILKELAEDQLKSGDLKESELWDLFTYILKNGKPPESLKEKISFKFFWIGKDSSWEIAADRTQLAKILGYIADKVAEQSLVQGGTKAPSQSSPSQQPKTQEPTEQAPWPDQPGQQ